MAIIKLKDILLESRLNSAPYLTPEDREQMATLSGNEKLKFSMAKRYAYLKSKGKCIACAKRTPVAGKTMCKKCLEKLSAYNRQRLCDLQKRGLCIVCGKNKVELKPPTRWGNELPNNPILYALCSSCREKAAKNMAQKNALKRANQPPKPIPPYISNYVIENQ